MKELFIKIFQTEIGNNIEVSEMEFKGLLDLVKSSIESKYSDFQKKYSDITKSATYKTAVKLEHAVKCYNEAPDTVKKIDKSLFINVQNLAKKLAEEIK